MLFKQLFLAATAAAFLVVPEVSEADEEIVKTLPIIESVDAVLPSIATAQSIGVPCRQCHGKNTNVQMDFIIEDGSRLTLNGFELYPTADPWHGDLMASVVRANGKSKEHRLGYSLSVKPDAVDMEQRLELVSVELRVIEIGSHFVDGMPTVRVRLIKAPSGKIIIGSVDFEEATEKEYENPLLRIKAKVEELFKKIKGGCSRHRQSGDHAHAAIEGERPHHGSHPHHNGEPHRHRQRHHNWSKLMKNIAANILLPVLAGITAGVGVAVLAMGLCSIFALIFRVRRKRCRRAARRSKVAITEACVAEEKAGLMEAESEDAPPQYTDDQEAK